MGLVGNRTYLGRPSAVASKTPAWLLACDYLLYSKEHIINNVRDSGINHYDIASDICLLSQETLWPRIEQEPVREIDW